MNTHHESVEHTNLLSYLQDVCQQLEFLLNSSGEELSETTYCSQSSIDEPEVKSYNFTESRTTPTSNYQQPSEYSAPVQTYTQEEQYGPKFAWWPPQAIQQVNYIDAGYPNNSRFHISQVQAINEANHLEHQMDLAGAQLAAPVDCAYCTWLARAYHH